MNISQAAGEESSYVLADKTEYPILLKDIIATSDSESYLHLKLKHLYGIANLVVYGATGAEFPGKLLSTNTTNQKTLFLLCLMYWLPNFLGDSGKDS